MKKPVILTLASALALGACGPAGAYRGTDPDGDSRAAGETSVDDEARDRDPFDEDRARERAQEEVASQGYGGPCTADCSGHDAGFGWAANGHEDGGVSSSPSFDEGQQAYEDEVEERVERQREDHEAGEDPDY
jgi:hypothetical protein